VDSSGKGSSNRVLGTLGFSVHPKVRRVKEKAYVNLLAA
jgi:hypothetical protein